MCKELGNLRCPNYSCVKEDPQSSKVQSSSVVISFSGGLHIRII